MPEKKKTKDKKSIVKKDGPKKEPTKKVKKEVKKKKVDTLEKKKEKELKKVSEREKKPKKKEIEKIKFHGVKKLSTEEKEAIAKRKKKPKFARQELHKLKKLRDVWRRPKGIDSKKHEGKRGKGKLPNIGYKNPDFLRGISPSGYYPILIHNTNELDIINPEKEAAIIASAVGRRKRNDIIKSANKLKITILNPRKGEM